MQNIGDVSSGVVLLDTAFLEPPAVAISSPAFRPIRRVMMADGVEVVLFRLEVAAASEALFVDLRDSTGGVSTRLTEVQAPPVSITPESYVSFQDDILKTRAGLYWVEPGSAPQSWGLSVALDTAGMSPLTTLTIAATSIGPTAVRGLKIELVDDFYYLVVLGDSIHAGNGLREEQKISSLVASVIETRLRKKVIVQRYAHSGATIRTRETDGLCRYNCFGEVPRVTTAIPDQVGLVQAPELINLVILDGCINDVGVATIIDPQIAAADLAVQTEAACGQPMVELLRRTREFMPFAHVMVTGYYPIISNSSDLGHFVVWADTLGLDVSSLLTESLPKVIRNADTFLETAHRSLQNAVDTFAAEDTTGARVAFADPGFDHQAALFTSTSWLWGLSEDASLLSGLSLDLPLFPMDETLTVCRDRCLELNQPLPELITCIYRSVGHPTPAGARAYRDSIVVRLGEWGLW